MKRKSVILVLVAIAILGAGFKAGTEVYWTLKNGVLTTDRAVAILATDPSTVANAETGASTWPIAGNMALTKNRIYVVTATTSPNATLPAIDSIGSQEAYVLDGVVPGTSGGASGGVSVGCSGNSIWVGEGSSYTACTTAFVLSGNSGYMLTFKAITGRGGIKAYRLLPTNVPVYTAP